jgi:N-acetylglucosaminyldiphosphoundecaprenol N-acetyl-beta-D-mannosaminyltransferase
VTESESHNRRTYGVLGMPIDIMSMQDLVGQIAAAKRSRKKLFISTPNLNFLIMAQNDEAFRNSVIRSDLCPVDGIGVMVVCKLLGIAATERVAGSDIPATLAKSLPSTTDGQVRMGLFGGENGAAELAKSKVNASLSNLTCTGALDPGRVDAKAMVNPSHIEEINSWNADFLLVALGAQKGQAWILQNMPHLNVPVISHLGATINFLAGTVKRAPPLVQKLKLEWFWRTIEEPKLASRYWNDATSLLWLIATDIIPLACWFRRNRSQNLQFSFSKSETANVLTMSLKGSAVEGKMENFRSTLLSSQKNLILDLSGLEYFDPSFCGELLLAEKHCIENGFSLKATGANPSITWALNKAKIGYLLQ